MYTQHAERREAATKRGPQNASRETDKNIISCCSFQESAQGKQLPHRTRSACRSPIP